MQLLECPPEPNSDQENPEQWALVCDWQYNEIEAYKKTITAMQRHINDWREVLESIAKPYMRIGTEFSDHLRGMNDGVQLAAEEAKKALKEYPKA